MPHGDYGKGLGGSGESHKPHSKQSEFLGHTKGNYDIPPNTYEPQGGTGEGHTSHSAQSEFLGDTKGNRDLATDRSTGLPSGYGGGKHKAGGTSKR